jgi:hypothetical protein
MACEKLLNQGRARPYRAQPREIERLLQVAVRELATAEMECYVWQEV